MDKRVVLKLDGDLEQQGFQVTLEIGEEGKLPIVEQTGNLPPAPDLARTIDQWKQGYQELSESSRIVLKSITVQSAPLSLHERLEIFRKLVKELEFQLKTWLESSEFSKILDRKLRESLSPSENIRILIRTLDTRLHHLPWHLWDFVEQYPHTEVVLGAPKVSPIYSKTLVAQGRVRILAILGDSTGIDVETDRQLLSALPQAEVQFLVQPTKQDLSDQLWQQQWHILFFAGHSRTDVEKGRLYINENDCLTLEEVKFGLRRSIANGLQLAIFNSCDGLGFAYELEQLNLPQLIVMREPVPDRVAQAFLKYLLTAFSSHEPLYLAVRQARERLRENLEPGFPCASWLPIIYQNPAIVPPVWQDWVGQSQSASPSISLPPGAISFNSIFNALKLQLKRRLPILWLSLATALLLVSLRFLGILEPLELNVFDQMLKLRPDEGIDPRILIVEITNVDIEAQKQRGELMQRVSTSAQTRGVSFDISLSDESLKRLLTVLAAHRPRVIGLDLYRDFPVEPGNAELAEALRSLPLISICKLEDLGDKDISSIDPSPEVPTGRIGFSDFQTDNDGILRRHLLSLYPPVWSADTKCTVNQSFSVQLAFHYLRKQNIAGEFVRRGQYDDLRLGNWVYPVLRSHTGGYHRLQKGGGGNQLVLSYRASEQVAERIPLTQILNNQINPDYITDKIVLIGATERSSDYWQTPYQAGTSNQVPGVIVQAHMVSQLINAALPEERRPLIWTWTTWMDGCWILGWSIASGILIWQAGLGHWRIRRKLLNSGLTIVLTTIALYSASFAILLKGGWVPFVPSAIAIASTGAAVLLHLALRSKLR